LEGSQNRGPVMVDFGEVKSSPGAGQDAVYRNDQSCCE
jgi:hypothetical protein